MEQLHEHNQKTYENICRMYNEGIQRVAVVQPTGSGKSLLMSKLIKDNPDSRFFILSTSHKINDQFKSKLNEEALKRVDFNIYCNMPNMKQEAMEELQPDYIFLDEMHRALAKEWSKGVKVLLEMYPNAKVLGLSATPIRYLDRCRNVAEELFGGNLACDMSLSQAILDGILPMARYVCGVYSYEKDTESLNKRIEKSCNSEEEKKELLKELKALKENLDKANGVADIFRKYVVNGNEKFVVFLKNTAHLREMKPVIEKWFTDAGFSVRMYQVHSKNVDKDKEFQAFKEDKENGIVKVCLSVNMLAEGIHGDIDGVIMLRETISPNMYFQMIGRAFSCGKKTIPLIFDLVANSQFISDAVDNFPNELKGEIEKRKEECEKEGKEYEVGFDVYEFIVMDYFMDVVSGFREIEGRLQGREWTEEENNILKKHYLTEGTKVADRLKGRTKVAVKRQARILGLNINIYRPWTEVEIELLKKYYPAEGLKVIDRLDGRTEAAILSKARKLSLQSLGKWNDKEIELFKKYYPIEGIKVRDRLDGRTEAAITTLASRLRLKVLNWTDKEYEILYKYYPIEGGKVKDRLNDKTEAAILSKARKLGIKVPDKSWTEEEIEILKKWYPVEGSKVIDKLSGRTKGAIATQASKLGLEYRNGKKYKYVYSEKNRYVVMFSVNGKNMRFGTFDSEEEAAKVAMQKAKEFGKAI